MRIYDKIYLINCIDYGGKTMVRYISVDAGKNATKSAEYLLSEDKVRSFGFCTKISQGDFRDDALE